MVAAAAALNPSLLSHLLAHVVWVRHAFFIELKTSVSIGYPNFKAYMGFLLSVFNEIMGLLGHFVRVSGAVHVGGASGVVWCVWSRVERSGGYLM